jgi:malonate decarboxylase delta subunit
METLTYERSGGTPVTRRAHVGVVASGDLELLLEPSTDGLHVRVATTAAGYGETWRAVFERFFARESIAASIEINDFGATPAVVALRLEQALEAAR